MSTYPADREADVVLRDGSTVHVRPVRGVDEPAVLAFLRGLSDDSRYLRFFSGTVDLADAARRAVDVDYHRKLAPVAEAGGERRVVAHAIYLATAPERAEVALAISDAYQGRGLGTILVGQLAEAANQHGIREFEARVLQQNHRMIQVFRESGFPVDVGYDRGEIAVAFPTSLSPEAIERFERREQTASLAAMEGFLAPRSVAVIGASRSRGTIGGEVFHNLVTTGFEGPVYPVNPGAQVVQFVVAYRTVGDIPGPVDLAVIVVPASLVVDVARQCGEKGVRALVVISSGFAEAGQEGRPRQHDLVVVCREFGMRLVRDVSVRITPLTDLDATEMVRSLATFPRLQGYRGAPAADVAALEDAILRVGSMVEAHPEIAELDCNPVMVLPSGVTVVDAKVRVEAPIAPLPLSARRRDA